MSAWYDDHVNDAVKAIGTTWLGSRYMLLVIWWRGLLLRYFCPPSWTPLMQNGVF